MPAEFKHLQDHERAVIAARLRNNESIAKIAEALGKNKSTISREIRNRAVTSHKVHPGRIPNCCVCRQTCDIRYLCEDLPNCTQRCSTCRRCPCNKTCQSFKEEICPKLSASPYVCNGCADERKCTLTKRFYINEAAQNNYRQILVEARNGANITEDELLVLDEILSPAIQNGQSVHHAVVGHKDEVSVSGKTIYRYIDAGLLKAKNIDLPRKCKLKPRKKKSMEYKVDRMCRVGRKFEDYQAFLAETPSIATVEMDSVEGRKGGKVLLTLMFTICDFQLAFICDRHNAKSVADWFVRLRDTLGKELFSRLFPLILTDNGSEFSDPTFLENLCGPGNTRVFYCHPNASFEKGRCERNHEHIRRICPKGTSLDDLTQADVNLMMSHVNSLPRPKWNDRTPAEIFSGIYGSDVIRKLGLVSIEPKNVVLLPKLLKK